MHKRVLSHAAALACGLLPLSATAQTAPVPAAPATVSTPAQPAAAVMPTCADCVIIPKLTPVRIEVLVDLGSKLSKTGDMFPIRLADPIVIEGKIVIPAGAKGMGEVIFAKGSGGGGAGGELVLAARYVDVGDKRLLLRSLQFNGNGKSRIDSANAVGIASSAAPGLAFVALFMKGKQSVVPVGTIADAKTAEEISLAPYDLTALLAPAATMPMTGSLSVPGTDPGSAVPPISQEKGKQ